MNRAKELSYPNGLSRVLGFSLLEMAVVLVIIAVLAAGGAVIFASQFQQRQAEVTQARMTKLQQALLDYRRTFKRLPCPADIKSYNVRDQYFGIEAANATGCNGSPAATYVYNMSTGSAVTCTAAQHCVYGGMVPTKTLKLPDDDAFDGWGNRIVYAVDSDFAKADAFVTQSDIAADVQAGTTRIIVRSEHDDPKTIAAVYVLLSAGANGHGAYPRNTVAMVVTEDGSRFGPGDSYELASADYRSIDRPLRGATASDAASGPFMLLALPGGDIEGGGMGGSGVGVQIVPRVSSGSANLLELRNCHCDTRGMDATYDNVFYQARPHQGAGGITDTFDDVLVYATRSQLRSATE